jgi:hypothetical protein
MVFSWVRMAIIAGSLGEDKSVIAPADSKKLELADASFLAQIGL